MVTILDGVSSLKSSFEQEPIGKLLVDTLSLPVALIWFMFVFLHLGILLIIYQIQGVPLPTSVGELFAFPQTSFYYPNLVAIYSDTICNPLFLVMLVIFRTFIPAQLSELASNQFLEKSEHKTLIANVRKHFLDKKFISRAIVCYIPLMVAVLGLVVDVVVYSPRNVAQWYGVLLSFLGRYAIVAIIGQFVCLFMFMYGSKYQFRLVLKHPDKCSGASPCGKLAIAGYLFLFLLTLLQSIGYTAFERALGNVGLKTVAIMWVFFPMGLFILISQLVFEPHRKLKQIQMDYLLRVSNVWTKYHQMISIYTMTTIEKSTTPLAAGNSIGIEDDIELIDSLAQLSEGVENMHTWPIPKHVVRLIAVVVNPILPYVFPLIVGWLEKPIT